MTTDSIRPDRDLPKWLWLGLPLAVVLAQVVTRMMGRETYVELMHSEFGLVENLTLVFLFVAIVLGIRLLLRRRAVPGRLFGLWTLLLTLGAVYFAGEEASWGYHLLGVEVMGGLKEFNHQQEPNLHNLEGIPGVFLDQTPRFLLTAAAAIGGILVPLWQRYKTPITWPTSWIWPTIVCLPTAVLAVGVTIPSKIFSLLGMDVQVAHQGEYKELFLALFMMMYLASLTSRLGGRSSPETPGHAG